MSDQAPVTPILLPQAGNTMEEGTILSWRVKPGDRVKVGEILFELETDKATIEVEAETAGRVARIVVAEGAAAPVKTPVAYLAESDTDVDAFLRGVHPTLEEVVGGAEVIAKVEPNGDSSHTDQARSVEPPAEVGRRKVSPAARKCAESLGVDVNAIQIGSGPDGRILREDVERHASSIRAVPQRPSAPTPEPVVSRQAQTGGGIRTPMSKMRRAIARNLALSKQTLPHWYTKVTIDAEPLLAYYRAEKALYPCTLNDVIVLAVGRVVMELAAFRTQIDGDDLIEYPSANIGIAVGSDNGLVVPVLRGADTRNLKGIAQETRRLVDNAKQGKLEGVGEAVFSISNLGMFGVEEFIAIINPPESGILSVGSVREAVVVKNGSLKAGKVMTMVLSADHRVIDGTMAAKFVVRLRELLESPEKL